MQGKKEEDEEERKGEGKLGEGEDAPDTANEGIFIEDAIHLLTDRKHRKPRSIPTAGRRGAGAPDTTERRSHIFHRRISIIELVAWIRRRLTEKPAVRLKRDAALNI